MKAPVLYTREQCPLCDQARALLEQVLGVDGYRVVDIDGDLDLIRDYGERIPVVAEPGTGRELGWPFSLERLRQWCAGRR